jgi:hypothetical protein
MPRQKNPHPLAKSDTGGALSELRVTLKFKRGVALDE